MNLGKENPQTPVEVFCDPQQLKVQKKLRPTKPYTVKF